MIKHYRKIPFEIEAIQWNGSNFDEIKEFCKDIVIAYDGELVIPILKDGKFIKSKEVAHEGDFIIKDKDKFHFCENKIFKETYEEVKQ